MDRDEAHEKEREADTAKVAEFGGESLRQQLIERPECGKVTQAALPKEAAGNFGPQLTALIAYLTVVCRMPRRVGLELIGQVPGIQLVWAVCKTVGKKPADHWRRQQSLLSWIS